MNKLRMTVWVTTQFEAYHKWEDAPDDVCFIRAFHRHIFEVKMEMEVTDDNREIEFFILKRQLNDYVQENFYGKRFTLSCEQIACLIMSRFKAFSVTVSEDGENGSTVGRIYPKCCTTAP